MDDDQVTNDDILDHGFWRHRIDLGDARFTPEPYRDASSWDAFGLPERMDGKTFLDIGASDGLFAFKAEQRGADRVLATDVWKKLEQKEHYDDSFIETSSRRGITLTKSVLDSGIKTRRLDVLELDPDEVGTFDVVLCASVLNYVTDPLAAIENLVAVTDELLVIRNAVSSQIHEVAAMEYLTDDSPNICFPTAEFLDAAVRNEGVPDVRSFHPDESSARESVPPVHEGYLPESTAGYGSHDLSNEQFRIPAGSVVDVLCRQETAYRVQSRGSQSTAPRQAWVSADAVEVSNSKHRRLLQKARSILEREGIGPLTAEAATFLRRELGSRLPFLQGEHPSSVVVHGRMSETNDR